MGGDKLNSYSIKKGTIVDSLCKRGFFLFSGGHLANVLQDPVLILSGG